MSDPQVRLSTPCGELVVAVHVGAAPLTAAHFLEFVRCGFLDWRSGVYRIVSASNCARPPAIEVVQFGWNLASEKDVPPLPPVPHEGTNLSGLRHVDGTLSLARLGVGTGTSAFFFCIGDQPALDHGGARADDGAGFAAFGTLVQGRAALGALHARATASEWLSEPLPITGHVVSGEPG